MALFTDGPPATMEDLAAQDSQLLDVASSEGIDLTVKLGLTYEVIGIELEELLRRGSGFGLSHVVVTPAMRLWHTYRTLEFVYRDAYNSQLNDRYAGKRDQFRELSKWAYDRLIQAGIGVTTSPIPRPPAPRTEAAGGATPPGSYWVSMAWVRAAGEEGEPSLPINIEVTSGGFVVTPAGAPAEAMGWNLYAGATIETMTRQNATPIAPENSWAASTVTTWGPQPGTGQKPAAPQPTARMLLRG